MASSRCAAALAATLLALGATWHVWYVLAQYIWYVLGSALLQARLAVSSSPVDTSWDGQAGFVWSELKRQPLATGTAALVVDIGAHDGVWQSNSFLMLQHGWRAVLVEPHPSTYRQLLRNVGRKFGGRAKLVRAAVGLNGTEVGPGGGHAVTRGWLDGTENRVLHSNCTPTLIVARAAHRRYDGAGACVPIHSLPDLLARLHVPRRFGVLSLDIEWSGAAVAHALRQMLRRGYRPEVLIVENGAVARPWLEASYGYKHRLTARYDDVYRLVAPRRPRLMASALRPKGGASAGGRREFGAGATRLLKRPRLSVGLARHLGIS